MNRRTFLLHGARALAGFMITGCLPAFAAQPRTLSFYHTHTGEYLDVLYARGDHYDPLVLQMVNRYLRDFRTGDIHDIDLRLLDILWVIQQRLGLTRPVYEVISGYRSPKTNAYLRRTTTGVAKNSLHMQGRAIDVRLQGVDTRHLQLCAIGLRAGGVGYYHRSNFVHLDTGSVRIW